MTQITSYKQAENLMAKARNISKGKPLGPRGWRIFKDGDEFAFYCGGTMVARMLPNNTLRMVLPDGVSFPSTIVYKIWAVIPVVLHRRSTRNYRLHPMLTGREGGGYSDCGYTNWDKLRTEGYRLHDGLTIDLTTRTAVDYKEPLTITNPDRNKEWLRKSKALKLHLKTIAKLGGFDAIWDEMNGTSRWSLDSIATARTEQVPMFLDALNGHELAEFVRAVGVSICADHYLRPNVADQIKYINSIFTRNSFTLRSALGVITQA
jgi:hypothetical protein